MEQHFEKVEWVWIWLIVAFLLSVVFVIGYQLVSEWIEYGFHVQMVAITILIVAVSVLIWWVLRSAATGFTEIEIVQKTLFGRRCISWEKVSRIEDNIRGGLRIHTTQGRIMVFGLVYSNYEELVQKLREKVERSGIRWKEVRNFE
jgi:hypothetical protein